MPKLLDLKLWFTEKPWCQSGADIPTGLGINIGDTALGNPLRQQPSAYCGGGGGGGGRLDRTALWAGTHSCCHFADIFHAGWDDHKPLLLHSVTGSAKAKRDEEQLRTVPARVFGCAPRRSVEVLHLHFRIEASACLNINDTPQVHLLGWKKGHFCVRESNICDAVYWKLIPTASSKQRITVRPLSCWHLC